MRLERHGVVFLLDLGDGENRLDAEALAGFDAALGEVERTPGDCALVTTARGSHFSNGYDLVRLRTLSREAQRDFVAQHERLLARLVVFPVPTVAALQGHAVGGGALLALAHDWRLMREDRGFFCLPEIDARIPFRPGMLALLRARLAPAALRDLALTGERLGGREALARGVVDEALPEAELLPRALERADLLARKDRRTIAKMKERMYGEVAAALRASRQPATPNAIGATTSADCTRYAATDTAYQPAKAARSAAVGEGAVPARPRRARRAPTEPASSASSKRSP